MADGLKSWNFWTPVYGTLYGYRCYHPDDFLLVLQGHQIRPRTIYGYGGKTTRSNWHTRMEEHMWGGGRYASVAKPWADTVVGWTPNGTVEDVIVAGGCWPIWRGWTVPLLLSWGEILIAIRLRRPYYNYQWNQGNRRRIPIYAQEDQRQLRDLTRGPGSVVATRSRPRAKSRNQQSVGHSLMLASPVARRMSNGPRWLGYYRRWVALTVLLGLVVLFWPGMPGADAVAAVRDWISVHRQQLIAMGVITGGLVLARIRKRQSRGRRRRSSRRR